MKCMQRLAGVVCHPVIGQQSKQVTEWHTHVGVDIYCQCVQSPGLSDVTGRAFVAPRWCMQQLVLCSSWQPKWPFLLVCSACSACSACQAVSSSPPTEICTEVPTCAWHELHAEDVGLVARGMCGQRAAAGQVPQADARVIRATGQQRACGTPDVSKVAECHSVSCNTHAMHSCVFLRDTCGARHTSSGCADSRQAASRRQVCHVLKNGCC